MMPKYDIEAIHRFCRERGIARLELFGSALRDDFRNDSDVDLLCTLTAEKDQHCGLLEWVDMQFKLEKIFGRPVDLVSRWAIERSRNPYRRNAILSTARPIYVEG
jgi:predicted nucleotidyltransferase